MSKIVEFCVRIRVGNKTVERIVPLTTARATAVSEVLRSASGSREHCSIESIDLEMCALVLAKAIDEARNA